MALPADLLAKLKCIDCGVHTLEARSQEEILVCGSCGARFPCEHDIPSLMKGGPEEQQWNPWNLDKVKMLGNGYYKRSTGELPEKEASKSYARYLKNQNLYTRGDSLLDMGCATGHFLISFRRLLDPEVIYTGIDANYTYVQWGREVFGISEHVSFVHCDALALPFVDNSFDTVIVNLFHFFPRLDHGLGECLRVARKNVVWRTPIGETNYIVKVLCEKSLEKVGVLSESRDGFDYLLYMLYCKEYIRDMATHLGGTVVRIDRDLDFEPFDNTVLEESGDMPATRTVGDMQINGNLVLDWQYVVIKSS